MQVLQEQIPAVIREITLHRPACLSRLILMRFQPVLEFGDVSPQLFQILLFFRLQLRCHFMPVPLPMLLQHTPHRTFQLPTLLQ